jgi:hypothetical protein
MAERSDVIAMRTPLLLVDVQDRMFRSGNQLKVRWGVVQDVSVEMVDLFGGSQLPFQESLHDNAMLGFVMPLSDHNVPVSVLDVGSREDLVADRLPVSPVEGVVVPTETFGYDGEGAPLDGTRGRTAIRLCSDAGISMTAEPVVVHAAHPLHECFAGAGNNRADHGNSPFCNGVYQIMEIESREIGGFVWLN